MTVSTLQIAARLDRLPVSRFHRRVLVALAFAFFFELADLNTFSYVAPALRVHLGMTIDQIAFITSASFVGMFLGATIGGRMADFLGRRRGLLAAVVWFSLFSGLNALAENVATMIAARFLTGVGLSAMTVTAITYLSETMPSAYRGRMQAATLGVGLLGIPVMAFFARGVIPISADSWRFVFLFGALGILDFFLLWRLPESPRWSNTHGQSEQAAADVDRIEADVATATGKALPPVRALTEPEQARSPRIRDLFMPGLGRRTIMLLIAWIFQTLGFYGFVAWVPTLLVAHGFSLTESLSFSALTTIGAVPGAFFAWPLSDRFGRKYPIVFVSAGIAAAGILYGVTFNPVAIVIFGFCVSFLIQTFAALLYAYTPEQYPTELRNFGSGLAYGAGRLANFGGPVIVALIFGAFGYVPVFVYIAICWVITGVVVAILGPRSGGVSLEALEGAESSDLAPRSGHKPARH